MAGNNNVALCALVSGVWKLTFHDTAENAQAAFEKYGKKADDGYAVSGPGDLENAPLEHLTDIRYVLGKTDHVTELPEDDLPEARELVWSFLHDHMEKLNNNPHLDRAQPKDRAAAAQAEAEEVAPADDAPADDAPAAEAAEVEPAKPTKRTTTMSTTATEVTAKKTPLKAAAKPTRLGAPSPAPAPAKGTPLKTAAKPAPAKKAAPVATKTAPAPAKGKTPLKAASGRGVVVKKAAPAKGAAKKAPGTSGISDGWKAVLKAIGKKGAAGATSDEIAAICEEHGVRPYYARFTVPKGVELERIARGQFRLTPAGKEAVA